MEEPIFRRRSYSPAQVALLRFVFRISVDMGPKRASIDLPRVREERSLAVASRGLRAGNRGRPLPVPEVCERLHLCDYIGIRPGAWVCSQSAFRIAVSAVSLA